MNNPLCYLRCHWRHLERYYVSGDWKKSLDIDKISHKWQDSLCSKDINIFAIKSPRSGFLVRFRCRRHRCRLHRRYHNAFCFSRRNRLSLNLNIWGGEGIRLGHCTGWPIWDLHPRSHIWHWLTSSCVDKVKTTHSQQNFVTISPGNTENLNECRKNSIGTPFWKFALHNSYVVFFYSRSNTTGHILRMISQLCNLQFDPTTDLDLAFTKVRFWNSCFSATLGLTVLKNKKQSIWILGRLYDLAVWPYQWHCPWSSSDSTISGLL